MTRALRRGWSRRGAIWRGARLTGARVAVDGQRRRHWRVRSHGHRPMEGCGRSAATRRGGQRRGRRPVRGAGASVWTEAPGRERSVTRNLVLLPLPPCPYEGGAVPQPAASPVLSSVEPSTGRSRELWVATLLRGLVSGAGAFSLGVLELLSGRAFFRVPDFIADFPRQQLPRPVGNIGRVLQSED